MELGHEHQGKNLNISKDISYIFMFQLPCWNHLKPWAKWSCSHSWATHMSPTYPPQKKLFPSKKPPHPMESCEYFFLCFIFFLMYVVQDLLLTAGNWSTTAGNGSSNWKQTRFKFRQTLPFWIQIMESPISFHIGSGRGRGSIQVLGDLKVAKNRQPIIFTFGFAEKSSTGMSILKHYKTLMFDTLECLFLL